MPEPTPRGVVRQHRRDLRECQDEDEVEVELERSDPMLGLCVLVAHSRTLARNDRGFETTSAPTEETVCRTGSRAGSGAHRDTASRFRTLLALRSRLCPVGATPECFQRVREALGFDPMRWVK